MTFKILTIFPRLFEGFLGETLLKRAQDAGILRIHLVNIRDYATDRHRTTDDTPYGGGPGMVMKIEPIFRALETLKESGMKQREYGAPEPQATVHVPNSRVVLLSPRGTLFTQRKAAEYATLGTLTLICGRYEGVDQRVADHLADEELSMGPYVLSGGEVAAMAVIETVSRLLPGFLGNPESLAEESFSPATGNRQPVTGVEYPQYTKPAEFHGWKVPDVLVSGNHEKVGAWRKKHTKTLKPQ